jgi:hypothetical protein
MTYIPIANQTLSEQTVTAAGATNITGWNSIVYCNASAGNQTLTLPAVATMAGRTVTVIKTDATANTVSVTAASGTLNGVTAGTAAIVLDGQNQGAMIENNATNAWSILDNYQNLGESMTNVAAVAGGSAITLTGQHDMLIVDAALGNYAITLPKVTAVASLGNEKVVSIKPIAIGNTFAVTVISNATDTCENPNSSPPTFVNTAITLPETLIGATWRFKTDFANNRWVLA